MTRYLWILERNGHEIKTGLATKQELIAHLLSLKLKSSKPAEWIVWAMEMSESEAGRAVYVSDTPAPNDWKLAWSRLG